MGKGTGKGGIGMVKDLRVYTFEDLAEARLNGFMDCLQVLGDEKMSEEDIRGLIKGYRSIWRREYMRNGQQDD